MRGNKGEWSELYAWLSILAEGQIYPANAQLEALPRHQLHVFGIKRVEKGTITHYHIDNDSVVISRNGSTLRRVPRQEFKRQANLIFDRLSSCNMRTFAIPEVTSFLQSIGCGQLKASSSQKADFVAIIRDPRSGLRPEVGYSVKSEIGGASTLLNAGKTTNFLFDVIRCDDNEKFNAWNALDASGKIKARINALIVHGGDLRYAGMESKTFKQNLILSDSMLPRIVASMVLEYFRGNGTNMNELVHAILSSEIELPAEDKEAFLKRKIKQLLSAAALGMVPSKPWSGSYGLTSALTVVKKSGGLVSFHLYNRDEFETYLFEHTRLDTASSTRHQFGQFYPHLSGWQIALNLQIRFVL